MLYTVCPPIPRVVQCWVVCLDGSWLSRGAAVEWPTSYMELEGLSLHHLGLSSRGGRCDLGSSTVRAITSLPLADPMGDTIDLTTQHTLTTCEKAAAWCRNSSIIIASICVCYAILPQGRVVPGYARRIVS